MDGEARKRKRAEEVVRMELVLPSMTNSHGTLFGGRVLEMMDMTCGIAAMNFCQKPVVTISSERVDFKVPIRAGSIVDMRAKVIYSGRTSLTVKVEVHSRHFAENVKRLCTTGYFNFVALDRTGRHPVEVPELMVESEQEKRDWEHARKLRAIRLQHRDGAKEPLG